MSHLNAIADGIITKFSKWKGHTLSLTGRRCLINSVIASSLVHSVMVYKWLGSLIQRMEIATCNFLLTGDITKKGEYNVNWTR